MNFVDTIFFGIGMIMLVPALAMVVLIGYILLSILAHAACAWLRTWTYYGVEMLGSSSRGQLRSVLFDAFLDVQTDQEAKKICFSSPRKFSAIVNAYDKVFF